MAHVEYGCPNCEQVMYRSRTAVSALDFKPLQTITCKNCLSAVLWFEMLPTKRGKLWLGGDAGGFSGTPPSVVGSGSFYDDAAATTVATIPNVTVLAGQTLVVLNMSVDGTVALPGDVAWNSLTPSTSSSLGAGAGVNGIMGWQGFDVSSTGTSDVTITFANINSTLFSCAAIAVVVPNSRPPSIDGGVGHSSFGVGTGTAPVSSVNGTPTSVPVTLIAETGTVGPESDSAGIWTDSFVAMSRLGTSGGTATRNSTISVAFRNLTSLSAFGVGKSGITNREWAVQSVPVRR
jgi:hypothetical protein